jgi:hypothetical protein
METINSATSIRVPWNKGKLVGQRAPFKGAAGFYVGQFSGDRLNGQGMIFMPGAGFYGTFVDNILNAPRRGN